MVFKESLRVFGLVVASAFIMMLALPSLIAVAQQSVCNGSVIMDLTPTSQVWCVAHVYQGDNDGQPTNAYPVYYGLNTAYQNYWSLANINSSQPILELDSLWPQSAGLIQGTMFWSGYYEGGPVAITLVGTYVMSKNINLYIALCSVLGNGFEFYLFIKPSGWSTTSPASNYSISYYNYYSPPGLSESYLDYDVILPYAIPNTKYIVVQWDPSDYQNYWPGEWNIAIVVGNGSSAPYVIGGDFGVGSGNFVPNPGDLIVVSVTYYPSNDTIVGYAYDLNRTGWYSSFSYNLSRYFAPPSPGNYTFGIGAGIYCSDADWGVMSVSEEGVKYVPLTSAKPTTNSSSTSSTKLTTSTHPKSTTGQSDNRLIIMKMAVIIALLFGIIMMVEGRKR